MIREEPSFKIKSANFSLFVLHLNTADMEKFKEELAARLAQTPGFYADAPMILGLAAIAESGFTPDFSELVSFMRAEGLCPAGVLGGSEEQREAAVRAGLGLVPEGPSRQPVSPQPEAPAESPLPPPTKQPELPGFETEKEEREVVERATEGGIEALQPENLPAVAGPLPTLVVDKPVRTGQRIYAKGANLVVLAVVNPGAELIADGDIHVYAPLRGRAIAGAHGNQEARIFVNRLEAELISIAGCYQVFENGIPENVRAKPAQVHLDGTRLIFQPLPS